jgi:hypothetical protein
VSRGKNELIGEFKIVVDDVININEIVYDGENSSPEVGL